MDWTWDYNGTMGGMDGLQSHPQSGIPPKVFEIKDLIKLLLFFGTIGGTRMGLYMGLFWDYMWD